MPYLLEAHESPSKGTVIPEATKPTGAAGPVNCVLIINKMGVAILISRNLECLHCKVCFPRI